MPFALKAAGRGVEIQVVAPHKVVM